MSKDVMKPLNDKILSGYITQGPAVEEFEDKLGKFIGNPKILTLNSATAGLTLGLRCLMKPYKLNNGDEWSGFDVEKDVVLSTPLTCFATTSAILANGAKIKWVDVDPKTANMDLDDLKKKVNEHTKVIYIVHWGGYPVDLKKLKEVQDYCYQKYNMRPMVVEDCAHAFGATFQGKKLGDHGNICVYSFQAIKHLTTGDGGGITLPNDELYERVRLLRWYGIDRNKRNYNRKDFRLEHDISDPGFKFHMNDINATMGIYNLPHIPELLEKARDNFNYYHKALKDVKDVELMENADDRETAAWLYTMKVQRKADFIDVMKKKNVMASQVHARNDVNSCVKDFVEPLPQLDELVKSIVCIPVGWWITKDDREYIVKCIKEGW